MNAEERFEKWWQRHGHNFIDSPEFKVQRIAWLACEAARDAEIERVAKEIENLSHGYESAEAVDAINECAHILRSILHAQPKEGEV